MSDENTEGYIHVKKTETDTGFELEITIQHMTCEQVHAVAVKLEEEAKKRAVKEIFGKDGPFNNDRLKDLLTKILSELKKNDSKPEPTQEKPTPSDNSTPASSDPSHTPSPA